MKDIVQGCLRGFEALKSGIYNLGAGQARSFNELVQILNGALGTNFEPEYIENPHAHYQNFTQADLTAVRARAAIRAAISAGSRRGRLHALAVSRLTKLPKQ